MLKLLKLLALTAIAIVLALLSLPTWGHLLTPNEPTIWENGEDLVAVYSQIEGGYGIDVEYGASIFQNSNRYGEPPIMTGNFNLTIVPYWPLALSASSGPSYLVTSGRASQFIENCIESDTGRPPVRVALESVATGLQSRISLLSSSEVSVYEIELEGLHCWIPIETAWFSSGSNHTFSMPATIGTFYSPDGGELGDRRIDRTAPICVSFTIRYSSGIVLASSSSPPLTPDPDSTVSPYVSWRHCNGFQQAAGREQQRTYAQPVSATFTDLGQQDSLSRNLFFAGALLGVLGGILVEIVSSTFDAVEALVSKVKGRRDSGNVPSEISEQGSLEVASYSPRSTAGEGSALEQRQQWTPPQSSDASPVARMPIGNKFAFGLLLGFVGAICAGALRRSLQIRK